MNPDDYSYPDVNSHSPNILLLSLKRLLANRIQKSIPLGWNTLHRQESEKPLVDHQEPVKLRLDEIPVQRVNDATQLRYVSAIAFRLEKLLKHPAMAIAQLIVTELLPGSQTARDSLSGHPGLSMASVWHHSKIWTRPPGWIHWQLDEPGLNTWLSCVVHSPLLSKDFPPQTRATAPILPFVILHTHARCCALLRLGAREGLLPAHSPSPETEGFPGSTPLSFSWTHPAEIALLCQLASTVDGLAELVETANLDNSYSDQWQTTAVRLAIALSNQFQHFDAACRIFGDMKTGSPAIAQGRLWLVKATQRLLHFLLETILDSAAPWEL